jgi:protein-arginine kinase activator protein McsA
MESVNNVKLQIPKNPEEIVNKKSTTIITVPKVQKIKNQKINERQFCQSCGKSYMDNKALVNHYSRNKLCKTWMTILEKKSPLAFRIQQIHIDKNDTNDLESECVSCMKTYSNIGNLNKHFKNNVTCRKLRDWMRFSSPEENIKNI